MLSRQKSNGKSRHRIHGLWDRGCRCGKGCFAKLQKKESELLVFLDLFWKLPKLQQDVYVISSEVKWFKPQ